MYVFDAHTHFFSRTFYEQQAKLRPERDILEMLDRMRTAGIEIPGEDNDAHRKRIVAELDENGIDCAVSFASVPEEMEVVGRAAGTSGGRLVPYAVVNPTVRETLDRFESLRARYNFKGIVLFPAMHGYHIGDDVAAQALDLAKQLRVVTLVHCGLLRVPVRSILGLDPDFPLDNAHPEDLIPVARARPGQAFIVPHFSAGFFDELLRLGKACDNVFVDTAGSNGWGMFQAPPLYLEDLFEQAVEVFGVQRILYGSDTAGVPRGYRRDVQNAQIRAMHDAGIQPADQELIMGGNLVKLLEV